MNNDIAPIKLENPISFNNSINSVLLMCENQVDLGVQDAGEICWVTGWGDTEGTTNSSQLQVVAVPITTESDYGWGQIDADMIMAGYEDGGYDSCQGDSGGPMVVLAADGETYLQCGIVSWGSGCADPGYPGVYTKVSYFIDWICENTDGVVCANESDLCTNNPVYGCVDITANNYNTQSTIDDGSCEYECDQNVSLLITFDCWPEETGWSIVNDSGSVIASQSTGFYSESEALETICLSEGCYIFTINDSYGDGMGGSQWSSCSIDGSYEITLGSEILINGDGDFGSSISHNFCISIISGCMNQTACNYNPNAIVDDGSCYNNDLGCGCDSPAAEEGYDCDGNCILELDCVGICGGESLLDDCGVCNGDNSSCSGCTDPEACNYDNGCNSILLDGVDDYVDLGNETFLNDDIADTQLTISARVKFTDVLAGNQEHIVSMNDGNDFNGTNNICYGFHIGKRPDYVANPNKLYAIFRQEGECYYAPGGEWPLVEVYGPVPNDNECYQIVVTYDSGTAKMYINGDSTPVAESTNSDVPAVNNTELPVLIGASHYEYGTISQDVTALFNGNIDEVQI